MKHREELAFEIQKLVKSLRSGDTVFGITEITADLEDAADQLVIDQRTDEIKERSERSVGEPTAIKGRCTAYERRVGDLVERWEYEC